MSSRAFRVHPALIDDLKEATSYYQTQDPVLPERLVASFAKALDQVEKHPFAGREYLPGFRRVVMVPFPYLLAYAVDEDHVHVAALLHVRLNPKSHEAALHSRS